MLAYLRPGLQAAASRQEQRRWGRHTRSHRQSRSMHVWNTSCCASI